MNFPPIQFYRFDLDWKSHLSEDQIDTLRFTSHEIYILLLEIRTIFVLSPPLKVNLTCIKVLSHISCILSRVAYVVLTFCPENPADGSYS